MTSCDLSRFSPALPLTFPGSLKLPVHLNTESVLKQGGGFAEAGPSRRVLDLLLRYGWGQLGDKG